MKSLKQLKDAQRIKQKELNSLNNYAANLKQMKDKSMKQVRRIERENAEIEREKSQLDSQLLALRDECQKL